MQKEVISGLNPLSNADLILVNSPLRDYGYRPKDDYEVLPPLGLAYIATQAAHKGHNIGLIDAEHHGLEQLRLVNIVNDLNPRYVGINVLTPTRSQALLFAERLIPEIPLIIGGTHATTLTEKTIREFSAVHEKVVLIKSEAELAVTAILDGQNLHNIPGAFWLEKGNLQSTSGLSVPNNLDELPQLDRKFLANDPSIDRHTGRVESRILTSRGCPFNCTICAGAKDVSGLQIRYRHAESVAQEIQGLIIDDNIQAVRFVDDLFISSEKRTRAILNAIKSSGISHLYWDATGRASILAKFGPDFFDYLKQEGASEIAIGIESGSERLREKINKHASMPQIQKSVSELTKRGIRVKGYFVIGLPTETRDETLYTLHLAQKLTLDFPGTFRASVFIFRPYPSTQEWKNLIAAGFEEDGLLMMHADGSGERAKHEVLTTQQFGECSPSELSDLLAQSNRWQDERSRTTTSTS
jgi:radical SAM superfamily enzyme YgiQ (UPF0313 family)